MVTVRLENIDKIFEQKMPNGEISKVYALKNINLTINDGETIAVVGPSGCGKSTLLRVIAGLENPTSGNVYFDDKLVNDVEPKDRGIGIVFQNYALYPHYKSKGNLSFFFKLRKVKEEEIDERVRITAETLGVGFDELLNRKPGQLSGGQQQRVALGRCIIKEPTIFLLDEPLSNLDAKLRERTRIELKRLLRRFKVTTFYVTHDQVEAITLGDRIAVMKSGSIQQVAPYREIYKHPLNMFVANFIGLPPMKFMDVTLKGQKIVGNGFEIEVSSEIANAIGDENRELTMGIRPENVSFKEKQEAGYFPAKIDVIEPLPNEGAKYLFFSFDEKTESIAKAELSFDGEVGDTIYVKFDPAKIYIFDKETEETIVAQDKMFSVANV
ncbi:MAG TPA: ABC transporter ATP-binding protein [Firmicutes bacterium]|jgi:multiple sugar transport system ATP-binding protein|nr:ABC transporter ATP-binding protein [Bacillota bacterium]